MSNRSPDQRIGTLFANRYELEALLGEGAMGAVYRARHARIGRMFAIKVLHPRLSTPKVIQRFEREAELAGRLQHPNVVAVVDLSTTEAGELYLVMDFVDGEPLVDLLRDAPMPTERVIWLARQLCEGLDHAHALGLVHRDFKPENVIVARDAYGLEQPRIVDFGVAILREDMRGDTGSSRLTTDGMVGRIATRSPVPRHVATATPAPSVVTVTVPVLMPVPQVPVVPMPVVPVPAPAPRTPVQPTPVHVAQRHSPPPVTPIVENGTPTAAAVTAQYRMVGQQLRRLGEADSTDALWTRYRRIRLGDCLSSAEQRVACAQTLDEIASAARRE